MADSFDPYYTWLGIPPEEQPPDHYRLLGVRRFETNDDVIANAADQRMAYLRTFQSGKRSRQSQALLNEIAAARGCLLDPNRRPQYDAELRQRLSASDAASGSAAVLPVDDLPPVLPVAMPLLPDLGDPAAVPPASLPPSHWRPPGEVSPPFGPPAAFEQAAAQAGAAPVMQERPAVSVARPVRPRRPRISLALAVVVGGGSFALGLIVLIATLLWAASQ